MAKKGAYKAGASKRSVAQRKYNSKTSSKKDRAARNKARRKAIKSGKVRKGDGKEIEHITPLSKGGSRNGKTMVVSSAFQRAQGGRLRSRKKKK